MLRRREFIRRATLAVGGACAATRRLSARQERRAVSIGGRRIRVVDAHAHCVIPVQHITKGTPLEKFGGSGNGALGPQRLQIMDQHGVDVQVLTINSGFFWYAAAVDLARAICREQNEGLAKWVAQHPDRFLATATIALQHPELAAEQLQDGVKRLGLRGASIGGHVNGEDLSLPNTIRSGPRPPNLASRCSCTRAERRISSRKAPSGAAAILATSSATRSRRPISCRD
jgi:aminocarboxymuconate-semialdehyde decarboxylase